MNATVSEQPSTTASISVSNGTQISAKVSPQSRPQLSGGKIDHAVDAHRDVLLAVQRVLAAHWEQDSPRIAVMERGGIATVYVSTARNLDTAVRNDIRAVARAAMAPYIALSPYTRVVFLHRVGG